MLADSNPTVQSKGVWARPSIGGRSPARVPALIRALACPNRSVARTGRRGPWGKLVPGIESVPALVSALTRSGVEVCRPTGSG